MRPSFGPRSVKSGLFLAAAFIVVLLASTTESQAGRWRRQGRRVVIYSPCAPCAPCRQYSYYYYPTPYLAAPQQPQALAPAPQILSQKTFVSPSGKQYLVVRTNEPGTEEELRAEREEQLRNMTPLERAQEAANTDNFVGTDRRDAKTSIADGDPQSFSTLGDLLDSLPDDDDMLHHQPPITRKPTMDRVAEEEKNVTVSAFIYAAKFESDHDFHLILGTKGTPSSRRYLNAEVSGLPRTGPDRERLKQVRDKFKAFFANDPIDSAYHKFTPPVAVQVTGSIFFDVDHMPGAVGPTGMKPKTSWEIHPITDLQFENDQ